MMTTISTIAPRTGDQPGKRGSVYDQITDRIIGLLESGTAPWRKPWRSQSGLPRNLVSNKTYRGINVFLLHAMSYESPYWITYRQLPVWRLGRWDELRGNLFWCASNGLERTRKIADSLLTSEPSPFILLLPTAMNLSSRLDRALKREGCLALALDEYLTIENDGKFRLVKSLETARQEFLERSAKRDTAKVLRGLEEKIDCGGVVIRSKGRARATVRFLFRPAGSMCDVVFDGSTGFHVKNTDGAKYLDYLLHRPNQAIRAFDLEQAVKPDKGQARDHNSIQKTVDSQTKREAREEMQELQAELEDAEAQGIISKVKRLQGEIAKLKAVVDNNSLLDSDTGERARDNVRKAISKVVANLRKGGKVEQSFAQHITQFISLGYDIAYNQPKGNCWE